MRAILCAFSLALACLLPVQAADVVTLGEGTPAPFTASDGQAVPFVRLPTLVSEPGETQDAFLLRVAQALSEFSFYRKVEACGFLWASTTGDHFAVPLGTINAHTTCLFQTHGPADDRGQAWVNTGLTIHSHPRDRGVNERRLSEADLKVAGYLVAGRQLSYHAAGSRDLRVIGSF